MAEETVVVQAEPKAAPVVEAKEPIAKPAEGTAPAEKPEAAALDPTHVYTQAKVNKITKKVKKKARYPTSKELEAFYKGREKAAPKPAEPEKPAVEDKPPTRDQYESYEAFLDAKAEYTGRKAATEYRGKAEA